MVKTKGTRIGCIQMCVCRTGVKWLAWGNRLALLAVLLCGLAPGSSGCAFTATSQPLSIPATSTPAVVETPVLRSTPTSTAAPGAPQKLTVWVNELVYPLGEGAAADVFAQQIAAFEATHPGLTIDVLRKKNEGKGSSYDYLQTASKVAPAVVPDLAVLDTALLPEIAQNGLAVPLDALVSRQLYDDLYPFAVQASTVDEQWMGVQFEVENVEHAIYNPSKIAAAPLTWSEVFSSGATYIFPAAGQAGLVNDAFLIQYLSTGAQLVDANGDPALDRDALTDVLTFYLQGIERGVILTDVLSYATVENCWPKYLQADAVISDISSNLYLAVNSGEAMAVPTRDGHAVTLSRGYAWVLTTRDPNRQDLAVKLLEWLMRPANVAAWSRAAGRLPTRRGAFEQMARDPYVIFMHDQLEYAVPYASSDTHQQIYRAMQQAINAVLIDGVLPETAAQGILQTVNQKASP
jgi:ABC-type glycerol-3-phosphate transport system substrate-binding protein